MKLALQYVNDSNGNIQAVQLPVKEWKKLMAKIKKYEETLKLKSDLKEAFDEVSVLKNKKHKQSLNDFLDEL